MDATQGEPGALNPLNAPKDVCEAVKAHFLRFLNDFVLQDSGEAEASQASQGSGGRPSQPHRIYVEQLATMRERELSTLYVNFEHLTEWDMDLAGSIVEALYPLEPYLRAAARDFVRTHLDTYAEREDGSDKEFWISFYNLEETDRLRQLRSAKIGRLSQFVGTVTRTSEVRPELFLGAFRCMTCMSVVRGVEQQFKYTQPTICPNPTCGNTSQLSQWELLMDESVFVDWQKARVQENPDEVPAGSLPRTMEVILRCDAVEAVRPGDRAVFTGMLAVVPDVAALTAPGERLQAQRGGGDRIAATEGVTGLLNGPQRTGARELTYRLAYLACGVQPAEAKSGAVNIRADDDATPEEVLASLTLEQQERLEAMRADTALYDRLASSVAPNVWGHVDVKRAVLLMLLGGVQKTTKEGIKLRGDINVAIVGDPATAKSQLLKYVAAFLPRAVYTSGKSSSAAGLTASVVRDNETGEYGIEAGALMLADNGICCIDEFDKMDVKDQVAIHEAMEQQTISIAKAGIQATLNARASVLAAANPVAGRYDRSKPLKYNVALPPAILSRFDLLHVMLDEPDPHTDHAVALHILGVHQGAGAVLHPAYSMADMQAFIKYARTIRPRLTPASQRALVAAYKRLRGEDAAPGSATAYRITVRQLEALVRLSEAIARLHLRTEVRPGDVREAQRLLKNSIIAVEQPDAVLDDGAEEEWLEGAAGELAGQLTGQEAGGARTEEAAPAGRAAEPAAEQAAAEPAGAAAAGEGAAAPAPKRSATRIPQQKYNNIKNLLVLRLRQLEEGGGGGVMHELGPTNVTGCAQRDLIKWYFDYLTARGAITSHTQAMEEIVLVEKVLAHLIKREQAVVVVQQPERTEGEPAADFGKRVQIERVLALNPNYSADL